ncbi:hypothetical protein PP7435_CHR1-0458 [Komagataella phaffii CBS 7435]|uniref:Uncharacterized protein n=2 Tax=Komagataella phaffii TaxID=460519 RepID=C4QW89_KOMPG|nr:Hypothetical protein PAS_chr1-1_0148 [Komagataella phaffii GS115]AOA60620.1 GQ67_02726T0 [Komagataella phaffii]CAH2446182.1 hypothetical protein BQ9382_C1-2370 [Komagataella phaffii CBS 7435]AOA66667.1 GQ68_02522T0 [Komagataella phaffii GS115]CAY67512.1 Hypothetical protein PAS_chr1-1_0148 [Komagataella phaffii GS115]CCA36610.1 hypothetical protein PP7435_CHR1-0458 [Komagataella phaffii CBS 7435]
MSPTNPPPVQRGRSLNSIHDKKRHGTPKKTQFTAGGGKKLVRNGSHGKNLNKLPRITSYEAVNALDHTIRPDFNRSKSTDGILDRMALKSLTKNETRSPELSEEEVEEFDDDVKVVESNSGATLEDSLPRLYGGDVLLSQSTGIERSIAPVASLRGSLISIPSQLLAQTMGEFRTTSPQGPPLVTSAPQNTQDTPSRNASLIFNPSNVHIAGTGYEDTRTQQKLWLQRESSLRDVKMPVKQPQTNGFFSTSQFRTEFERYSKEYLNVRRYVNPVAESLKRLDAANKVPKDIQNRPSTISVKEIQAKAEAIKAQIWNEEVK